MGSWPPIPTPLYFVDAQRVDSAGFSSLSPNDIANIQVVKGAAARALDASATGRGLIAITTKQNEQNAKALAFSQQVERVIKEYKPHSEAVIQAENAIEPADLRYYLNNSASTILELNSLDAHTVTGVRTLHGQRAANYAHDASVTEVILVTTRP